MRRLRSMKGFTLVEVLVALAVSGMLLAVAVSTTFQTTYVTTHTSGQITALEDIKDVARHIIDDVWAAQETDLEEAVPPVGGLVLDWTNWYEDTGQQSGLNPVDYHCEYTLLQAGGQVQRSYWEAYDPEQPGTPTTITALGKSITSIEFSRDGNLVTVTIASTAGQASGEEEEKTYRISMKVMEEVPQ